MHSRIFQVSENPITDLIHESRYDEYLVGQDGIDYVVESESRAEDIEGLKHSKGLEITENTIKVVSKKEYFESKKINNVASLYIANYNSGCNLDEIDKCTKINSIYYEVKIVEFYDENAKKSWNNNINMLILYYFDLGILISKY